MASKISTLFGLNKKPDREKVQYPSYDHMYNKVDKDSFHRLFFKAGQPASSPSLVFSSVRSTPRLSPTQISLCSPQSWSHVTLNTNSPSSAISSFDNTVSSPSRRYDTSPSSLTTTSSSYNGLVEDSSSSSSATVLRSSTSSTSSSKSSSLDDSRLSSDSSTSGLHSFPFDEYQPLLFSPPSAKIEVEKQLLQTKILTELKEKRTEEAWETLQSLKKIGMLPTGVCLSALVAQLCHNGAPSSIFRAQTILSDLQKMKRCDLLSSDALRTLAMICTRAGAARYALSVLKIMSGLGLFPPVNLWSAVVSRLSRHADDCFLALELFEQISVFLRESKAQKNFTKPQIKGLMSMRPDTGAFNAALYACATVRNAKKAKVVWEMMPEFDAKPSTLSFNILIKVYARTNQRDLLKGILPLMEKARIEPDQSTLNSLVSAHVGLRDVNAAETLLECLQDRKERGEKGYKKIRFALDCSGEEIYLALKSRNLKSWEARLQNKAFKGGNIEDDKARWGFKLKPDGRTYTTLLEGYAQNGRIGDALELLWAMQQQKEDPKILPDATTYTTAIAACVRLSLVVEGCRIVQAMTAHNVPASVLPYNVLLQGYCSSPKVNKLKKALQFFSWIEKSGISMDVVTYNILLRGCMKAGDYEEGLKLFRQIHEKGPSPSELTYKILLREFAQNGQSRLALEVFENMQLDKKMIVHSGVWNALIESFCRAGRMVDAKEVFGRMKEAQFVLSAYTNS